MTNNTNTTTNTIKQAVIKNQHRFIKVTGGDDGNFYDLVDEFDVSDHIELIESAGYTAQVVPKQTVPPCIFRDFTAGDLSKYIDGQYLDGKDFYHTTKRRDYTNYSEATKEELEQFVDTLHFSHDIWGIMYGEERTLADAIDSYFDRNPFWQKDTEEKWHEWCRNYL